MDDYKGNALDWQAEPLSVAVRAVRMPFSSVPNPLRRMMVPMIPLPGVFYPASLAV
jgi:hypothetical protein